MYRNLNETNVTTHPPSPPRPPFQNRNHYYPFVRTSYVQKKSYTAFKQRCCETC